MMKFILVLLFNCVMLSIGNALVDLGLAGWRFYARPFFKKYLYENSMQKMRTS